MSSLVTRWVLALGLLCCAAIGEAQTLNPGPPGPYVVDLRGISLGIPSDPAFYPVLPEDSSVPARGFGADIGAHVYPLALGRSRIGFGVDVLYARGSITGTGLATVTKGFAPQVSFNFGSRDGWSYLSAGYGTMSIRSEAPLVTTVLGVSDNGVPVTGTTGGTVESGTLGAINFGGGARWFLSRHLAVGFDLRFYRLAAASDPATPSTMLFGAAAGVSFR